MNLFKSSLLFFAITTVAHLNVTMSPDLAGKTFVYNKIDTSEKYRMFTRGTTHGNTIFDITFPLVEQKKSNKDIFNYLLKTAPTFTYQGKQESVAQRENSLNGNITGFIDVLKNQYQLFTILMPAILAAHNQEPEPKEEEETPEWHPQPPKMLSVVDKNIQWAQEELMVELDFYIMEFGKLNEFALKPSEHKFELWLQGLDNWWIQETFERWVTKSLNLTTKDRKALPTILFPASSLIFFISTYLPKMILIQDPTRTKVSWDILKDIFPGFIIYSDKKLFNFAQETKTKQSMSFLVKMVNENLTKMIKNNPIIGQVLSEKQLKAEKKQSSMGLGSITKTLGGQCRG